MLGLSHRRLRYLGHQSSQVIKKKIKPRIFSSLSMVLMPKEIFNSLLVIKILENTQSKKVVESLWQRSPKMKLIVMSHHYSILKYRRRGLRITRTQTLPHIHDSLTRIARISYSIQFFGYHSMIRSCWFRVSACMPNHSMIRSCLYAGAPRDKIYNTI